MIKYLSNFIQAVFIFSVAACRSNTIQNDIIIEGTIRHSPPDKIYLFDVSKHDDPEDSAYIINGKFIFRYKADSSFSPHEVALSMIDSFKIYKYLKQIGFYNPYKLNTIESAFFLDRGVTSIEGDSAKEERIFSIKGSRQNIPMYKHIEFNSLRDKDSLLRQQELTRDIQKIDQYPYSYYLGEQLYRNREMYKKEELELLMSKFNSGIKGSELFKKLKSYLLIEDRPRKIDNFFLETAEKNKEPVIDTSAKYNLLIFWASWCAPCRKEIPELKKIFGSYPNKELSFSSISLDNNFTRWNKALEIEKMPWKQFIINDSAKNKLDIIVNLSSIPLIVLLDNKGCIIMREMGFDEKSPTALMETIKKHLD